MASAPHHDLSAIQAEFAAGGGSITTKAINDARLLNYTRSDIVDIVGELQQSHFVKSAPGNNGQPGNWHDAYNYYDQVGGIVLYVKFAGTSIIDITLTSFKEK